MNRTFITIPLQELFIASLSAAGEDPIAVIACTF
jgi:hypothetical protein